MRIALRTPDGVFHWLAGNPGLSERDHSSAGALRIAGDIVTQEVKKIRAAAAVTLDRANLKTTLSFGTVRKFSDAATAELWSADYDLAQPRVGLVILESVMATGGVTRRYLPDAVVHSPGREVTGVSVALSYTISGGAINPTPPTGLAIPL